MCPLGCSHRLTTMYLNNCVRFVDLCTENTTISRNITLSSDLPARVAQLDARPTGDQAVVGSTPRGQKHSFVEIDCEIFSTAFLSLPLIQEGQLSVSVERMCTILINSFGLSLPSKSVVW